jgi:hypothetical protein
MEERNPVKPEQLLFHVLGVSFFMLFAAQYTNLLF